MKLDISLDFRAPYTNLEEICKSAEDLGFSALWHSENQHDGFLPMTMLAINSTSLQFGTRVAIAFARTPMTLAYIGWDLQYLSKGRFIMGLGSQVKGHIKRRFDMPWESPAPKMKEFVQALRAIWDCWQNNSPLKFEGRFYNFSLMPPMYNPGPIEHPHIPIYLSAFNKYMCRVVGEVADGIHVHPFHTTKYLREVVLPEMNEGARRAGRSPKDITFAVPVMLVTGKNKKELDAALMDVRTEIAFYASTRTYAPFMERHGWGDLVPYLHKLSVEGQWDKMPLQISDEMIDQIAIVCQPDEICARVKERYGGLADRVLLRKKFIPGADDAFWKEIRQQLAT